MANPVWPGALPQTMRLGLEIETVDPRAQFQPDTGTPRMAVRTTAAGERWRPQPIVVGETQYSILRTFVDVSCFHGTLPFDWTNPRPGDGVVTFQWETLPVEQWSTRAVPLPVANDGAQAWRAGGAASQRLVTVRFTFVRLPWFPVA